ncbi:hypothetical protein FNH05_10835 [Amycolatopsis rhizosphaerae]|uniref:Uncharacterized protein n=1 Tax=Amycolatopsis rhizosphaerae TaxID=2053003 RepID=A0A558CZ67_9PSEU|nr:hypothetical protein [Amycolatopsis rhizosphaerae]TVT54084.1 hypothetical protein FNH05_10835 [Amycolatopsis rhizosphaerae]
MRCGCGHEPSAHGDGGCQVILGEEWGYGLEASDSVVSTTWCPCSRSYDEFRDYAASRPPALTGLPSMPERMAREYPENDPARAALEHLDGLMRDAGASSQRTDAEEHRRGWLKILDREDADAASCVRHVLGRFQRRELFPFHGARDLDPARRPAAEWSRRLHRHPRTAAVELVEPTTGVTEILIDPQTRAPVVRTGNGLLRTVLTRRLPGGSPLAELVLDQVLWVRTVDNELYLSPHQFSRSERTSPEVCHRRFARLIEVLLTDIAADAARIRHSGEVAPGLLRLAMLPWPEGTVLPRSALEAARAEG